MHCERLQNYEKDTGRQSSVHSCSDELQAGRPPWCQHKLQGAGVVIVNSWMIKSTWISPMTAAKRQSVMCLIVQEIRRDHSLTEIPWLKEGLCCYLSSARSFNNELFALATSQQWCSHCCLSCYRILKVISLFYLYLVHTAVQISKKMLLKPL